MRGTKLSLGGKPTVTKINEDECKFVAKRQNMKGLLGRTKEIKEELSLI